MLTTLLRILGTILLWSDIGVITTLVLGVVLILSGREDVVERSASLLFLLIVIGVIGRIVAGVHVLLATGRTSGDRFDAFLRHVFVTGMSASHYLRNLNERAKGEDNAPKR